MVGFSALQKSIRSMVIFFPRFVGGLKSRTNGGQPGGLFLERYRTMNSIAGTPDPLSVAMAPANKSLILGFSTKEIRPAPDDRPHAAPGCGIAGSAGRRLAEGRTCPTAGGPGDRGRGLKYPPPPSPLPLLLLLIPSRVPVLGGPSRRPPNRWGYRCPRALPSVQRALPTPRVTEGVDR